MRAKAESDFGKDMWKLLANSVFGKFLEDVRNHVNCHFATTREEAIKAHSKDEHKKATILNEDLTLFMQKKGMVHLNKPIQVGAVVLSRSKLHMLRMLYLNIKSWWPNRVWCLYTDTDSLILLVQTENVYKDLQNHLADDPPTLDTSNYPKSHPLFSTRSKKVPGPVKDECAGLPLEEVVLLAPKVKALRYANHDDFTGKGLKKHLLKKLTF